MKTNRKCIKCNKNDDMNRIIDKKYKFYDTRYRICFKCEPILKLEEVIFEVRKNEL